MSEANHTSYQFFPYVRLGLATRIQQDPDATRASIAVDLKIRRHVKGKPEEEFEPAKGLDHPLSIQLYGPGDILGFDDRVVARTDPRPDANKFEPNYFPAIEFSDPGFVWQFSPQSHRDPDDQTKLRKQLTPWLTLIVLVEDSWKEGVQKEFKEHLPDQDEKRGKTKLPRCISVHDPYHSLPDLSKAHQWAHLQFAEDQNLTTWDYEKILRFYPESARCRLLCPRRLHPKTKYAAFVVPTFKLGHMAGLGEDIDEQDTKIPATALAWNLDDFEPVEGDTPEQAIEKKDFKLPYYYRWEFITGKEGDVQHLIQLLKPRELTGLVSRNMDCGRPGYGLPGVERSDEGNDESERHFLGLEGALRSAGEGQFTSWGSDDEEQQGLNPLQSGLAELINSSGLTSDADSPGAPIPKVVPPIYGRWHAGKNRVGNLKAEVSYGDPFPSGSVGGRVILSGEALSDAVVLLKEENKVTKTDHRGNFYFSGLERDTASLQIRARGGVFDIGRVALGRGLLNIRLVTNDTWLEQLNLDPRHRVAAGIGAEIIRKEQEDLMASAWEQLGELEGINELTRIAQLGREISIRTHERFKRLGAEKRLAVLSPLQDTLDVRPVLKAAQWLTGLSPATPVKTLRHALRAVLSQPEGSLDPAFRRLTRPRGPIRKRQKTGAGDGNYLVNADLQSASAVYSAGNTLGTKKSAGSVLQTITAKKGALQRQKADLFKKVKRLGDLGTQCSQPELAIFQWVKSQVVLDPDISDRFEQDAPDPRQDPFNRIDFAPDFPQPMYTYLRNLSPQWLLPGIEMIPQNTVGILKTNPRFIETFLCGCNHEFAGELLWREYPTDQRGSYFRQFWDVDDRVPTYDELEPLLANWVAKMGVARNKTIDQAFLAISDKEKVNKLLLYLDETQLDSFFEQNANENWVIRSDTEVKERVNDLYRQTIEQELWEEHCRDITPISGWGDRPLGDNMKLDSGTDNLVLIIRGDLLRRYPNTLIYAVNAVERGGQQRPALREFLQEHLNEGDTFDVDGNLIVGGQAHSPIFPIFRGDVASDMTFLGFPFPVEYAREGNGLFFIFQERMGETRFGLDAPAEGHVYLPGNLSWSDFGYETDGDEARYGVYLETKDADLPQDHLLFKPWEDGTSAFRAAQTFQKPVKIAINADRMLPKET